jgi:DNA topoisomerase IB
VRHGGIGLQRRRRGRGFSYLDVDGTPVKDTETLERIRSLAIPPAWTDVWICPDPDGHLQATGRDAAGRLQYRYHPRWRANRDERKFERIETFAERLPEIRDAFRGDLEGSDLSRGRVLGCAVALLDDGLFRIGSEDYARRNGSFGLATLLKEHVTVSGGEARFDFPAKSGVRRRFTLDDPDVVAVVSRLKRRRNGGEELLAYRDNGEWHDVRSSDINAYLKELAGGAASAKDFRTWHATVLAAVRVAVAASEDPPGSPRRVMSRVAREVSEALGNTPAVARNSYIDPRVFDRYERGETILPALQRIGARDRDDSRIRGEIEAAVLALLRGEHAGSVAA